MESCTYKKAKSDGKYSYVIKKKLFDLKKEKDNYTIPQCMASDGKYIYIITAYFPNTIKFENDFKTRRK